MFIIFGSPRSGTTLLSSILDLNDHLTLPDETDFIIPLAFIFNRVKNEKIGKQMIQELIISSERFQVSLGEYLTAEEIRHIINNSEYKLSALISNIYKTIAIKTGASMAGDKSPNDLLYIRVLVESNFFTSDIKIIHLVRDIRDVILSLNKVDWDVDWKSNLASFFPRMWSDSNLYLHTLFRDNSENYTFIKYEEMITNPEFTFRKLSDFLKVPFQKSMLDSNDRGMKYLKYDHHQNLSRQILSNNISLWKEKLDKNILEQCNRQALEALETFGYL